LYATGWLKMKLFT